MNFDQVATDQLLETSEQINNRPLKLHNYRNAIEVLDLVRIKLAICHLNVFEGGNIYFLPFK